jgi:hypothetical protein
VSLNRVRLALSLAGMVVAVIAIMLEDRRVIWGAIALLAVSLLLRIVGRHGGPGGGRGQV